jgi:hypothetical protein
MAQPPQLARAYKPRKSSRPIVELLPAINVKDLRINSLNQHKERILRDVSLRWPFLAGIRFNWDSVEFYLPSLHRNQLGAVFEFKLIHIKAGTSGSYRHAFICQCGRAAVKLYERHRRIACKECHGAVWSSQTIGPRMRPILQASRIQSFLDNKRLMHKTKERLRKRLGDKLMLAQRRLGTRAHTGLLD